jgi:hypothetical protein
MEPNVPRTAKLASIGRGFTQNAKERIESLQYARERIARFQAPYHRFLEWSQNAQSSIQSKVETLYRACQSFASNEILKLTEQLEFDFSPLNGEVAPADGARVLIGFED